MKRKMIIIFNVMMITILSFTSLQFFANNANSWNANAGETTQYLTSYGNPIIVPIIRRSDTNEILSCMQSGAYFPQNTEYEGLGNPYFDYNILGIMYYGDVNKGIPELAQQYGLDWYKAHYGWQVALWRVLKQKGYPVNPYDFMQLEGDKNLINYINDLTTRTFENVVQDFDILFDGIISKANPQKTNPIPITASIPYHVDVPSPLYITGVDGIKKTNFNADENFIVVAPPRFKGNITAKVTTEQITFTTMIYRAMIGGTQEVGKLYRDDPAILNKEINLDFLGAYDIIDLTKSTSDKQFLPNTVYEFADDPNFTNAKKITTDSNGKIHEEELLLAGEIIYIREYSVPILNEHLGYNTKTDVTQLSGIGGETHTLEFQNEEIKGKICINKVDQDNNPLQNVQFDVLSQDGRFLNSKNTDKNGRLCFDDLELGIYKIVERTPDDYTAQKLVYDIDLKIDDELVQLGYNRQSDYVTTVLLDIVNEKIVTYNPSIKTLATGINGEKEFKPNTDIEFIDYVEYTGLIPNQEYTLTGVIMDKSTGKPLFIEGVQMTVTTTFKTTNSSGVAEVYFKFNTAGLEGKDLVVFESLKQNESFVTKHEDINDERQTVHIKETILVSAGQNVIEALFLGISLLGISIFTLVKLRKGKHDATTH